MTLFKGGISKVEYDDAVAFASATEIPGIMKSSKVTFKTPTEDNAAGKSVGSGKQVDFQFDSEDLTVNVYTELIAAEAAHTDIFFRITGINTAQKLVLKATAPIVELAPAEAGKNWKRVVKGTGFADTEANLTALTLA